MTAELIRKAEEYKRNHWSDNVTEMNNQRTFEQVKGIPHFYGNAIKQAYIAGATENGIHWHDLRKDPNDLPKFRHDILVTCEYRSKLKKERETFEWDYDSDMPLHAIAWCEKPQFEG